MSASTPRTIATTLGLAAFVVAIVAGLAAGNDPSRVLSTAIVAMICCQVLGLALGAVGQHIVSGHLASITAHADAASGDHSSGTSENPQVIHNG